MIDVFSDFLYKDITTHADIIKKLFQVITKLKPELYDINDVFPQNVIRHF